MVNLKKDTQNFSIIFGKVKKTPLKFEQLIFWLKFWLKTEFKLWLKFEYSKRNAIKVIRIELGF